MLSAWDKGTGEGLSPIEFLRQKLPLLHQYLENAGDNWNWRVYGVSAQGGEYEEVKEDAPAIAEARSLRELDVPSERIKLVDETSSSHDLTEPLKWLAT
jgi:hypothetical protein